MKYIIREATNQDTEFLCRINKYAMGYDCPKEKTQCQLEKVLCDDKQKVFVAEIERLVVGYVHATTYDLLYANAMVNIMGLAVLEEYRHNGIAAEFIQVVEEWAKNIGADAIRLTSGKEREEAHKFYGNAGFEKKKEQINFMKELRLE
jgi:predicted N-acetyltransferase YhbS